MFTKSSLHLCDNHRNVVHEHIDRDGEQNHAEELAENENQGWPEQILDFVEIADDHVVQGDVKEKANEDVHDGVVGTEGEQTREGARSCDERERHRHDARAAAHVLVLDDFASQNHLHREDEQHKRARHSEGCGVDAEHPQ